MGQDAALGKDLELVFDKLGRSRFGFRLNVGKEGLDVLLYPSGTASSAQVAGIDSVHTVLQA
jgi:hypothetical protein